jgi:ATP-dependent helicase/nuclease subunit A
MAAGTAPAATSPAWLRTPSRSARFLALRAPALDASRRAELASRALAVLATPALAPLFAEGAQAEVSLAGRIEARPGAFIDIVGQIDRLAVTGDEVLVADFKTGAPRAEGETPPVYLAQLALYRAALAAAWPGRRVRMLLVWTDGPTIVEPSAAALDAALARVAAP